MSRLSAQPPASKGYNSLFFYTYNKNIFIPIHHTYMHLYTNCRLLILTSHNTANGKIFEQYENAAGLVKLLSAIGQQLMILKLPKRLKHAANLLPMSRVLVMLVSAYEGIDHMIVTREVACTILNKYSDVPSAQSEEVVEVLGNAVFIVELLVVRCSKLTFSVETNTYTAPPFSDRERTELRTLMKDLLDDDDFCSSMATIIGQTDCPLRLAGQVSSLLRCLFHADLLCFDALSNQSQRNRFIDRIILSSSTGLGRLPDLTRLLERETALALPVRDSQERIPAIVAALHHLCCVIGLLRSLLPLLRPPAATASSNLTQQQQQQQGNLDDAGLAHSLDSLGQWLRRLGTDDLGASAEAKQLLRALLEDSARFLEGGHSARWPLSSAALTSLLAAALPLGLGPQGQGSSQPAAAEVNALRAEIDNLLAEIQVLRSQVGSHRSAAGPI